MNNKVTWKERNKDMILTVVVGVLLFVALMSVWLMLTGIAGGQGR